MSERQPYQPPIPEPQRTPHEGGNCSLGLPRTVHESAKPPPPESTLSRAVERTRTLYERNGWVFLPLGEVGKGSPRVPTLQGEQAPHAEDSNGEELTSEEIRKANEDFFEMLRRINPEARERAQKRLLDYLFRRLPQDPEQEK